jgi:hypothetical protein
VPYVSSKEHFSSWANTNAPPRFPQRKRLAGVAMRDGMAKLACRLDHLSTRDCHRLATSRIQEINIRLQNVLRHSDVQRALFALVRAGLVMMPA